MKKNKKKSKKAAENLKKENGNVTSELSEKSLKTGEPAAALPKAAGKGLDAVPKKKTGVNQQQKNQKQNGSVSQAQKTQKITEQLKTQKPSNPASTVSNPVVNGGESPATENKKKKRNRRNKKRKSDENNQSVLDITVSDDEEIVSAPPNKLRKLNQKKAKSQNQEEPQLLPNPFAAGKAKAKAVPAKPLAAQQDLASSKKAKKAVPAKPLAVTGQEDLASSKKKKSKTGKTSVLNSLDEVRADAPVKNTKKTKIGTSSGLLAIKEAETQNQPKKAPKKTKKAAKPDEQDETDDSATEGQPPDVFSILGPKPVQDSVKHGESLFNWLVHPIEVSDFMTNHWEKAPLYVKRSELFPAYYDWILNSSKLDDILRKNVLKYSENLDITAYEDGKRETVSKDMLGRARPAAVWDLYSTGHSVRILNPQTYSKALWRLNASLQEMFGCFVGANVYLTPPDSQGFAPHYDDIEAFILQVEGKKQWRLYKPRNKDEELPRFSSVDFNEELDNLGQPVMEVTLEAGDLLYFPRGMIHQAKTVEGHHSMHITLSCYQQNTYGDLLKQHFSKALEKLTSTDISFRRGLPVDYLSFMGRAHDASKDKSITAKRKAFKETLKQLIDKVMDEEADDAADEMGKKFIWDSLPPYLTKKEKDVTVEEDGEFLNCGRVRNRVEIDPDVEVKLLRKHCVRLVQEEGTLRLYFSIENPLVYHQQEAPEFVEFPPEFEPAVKHLINAYPQYTKVEDLPVKDGDISKKIQIVGDLWERGILMTKKPLEAGELDDEDVDFDDLFGGNSSESEDMEGEEDDDDEGEYFLDDDSYADQFMLSDEDTESSEIGGDEDDEDDDSDNAWGQVISRRPQIAGGQDNELITDESEQDDEDIFDEEAIDEDEDVEAIDNEDYDSEESISD